MQADGGPQRAGALGTWRVTVLRSQVKFKDMQRLPSLSSSIRCVSAQLGRTVRSTGSTCTVHLLCTQPCFPSRHTHQASVIDKSIQRAPTMCRPPQEGMHCKLTKPEIERGLSTYYVRPQHVAHWAPGEENVDGAHSVCTKPWARASHCNPGPHRQRQETGPLCHTARGQDGPCMFPCPRAAGQVQPSPTLH